MGAKRRATGEKVFYTLEETGITETAERWLGTTANSNKKGGLADRRLNATETRRKGLQMRL